MALKALTLESDCLIGSQDYMSLLIMEKDLEEYLAQRKCYMFAVFIIAIIWLSHLFM